MFLFGSLVVIAVLAYRSEAAVTANTISDFNIGQLFAFYDTAGLCAARNQFAVAKRDGSGKCQWKIAANFALKTINNRADLPIEDFNRNCYFACVPATSSKKWHTEKIINRKLVQDGVVRSGFDMYTYLAPCTSCIDGSQVPGGRVERADLTSYNGVFYSYRPNADPTMGTEVKNDDLLEKNGKHGLDSIKQTTEVDISEVRTKVVDGKAAGKTNAQIINDIAEAYLKNAVESYFAQHP